MAIDLWTTTTYLPKRNEAIDRLIEQFASAETRLRETIEPIYAEIIKRYGPGGTFLESAFKRLERQKTRDVGQAIQTDISRGLYGIKDYGAAWEEAVGAGARAKLEDIAMQRLSQAQAGYASYLERSLPDLGLLANLASAASSAPAGQTVTSYATTRTGRDTGSHLVSFGQWTPSPPSPEATRGGGVSPAYLAQSGLAKEQDRSELGPTTFTESMSLHRFKKRTGLTGKEAIRAWRAEYDAKTGRATTAPSQPVPQPVTKPSAKPTKPSLAEIARMAEKWLETSPEWI